MDRNKIGTPFVKLQNYLFKVAEKPAIFFVVFFLTVCESIFLFIPTEVFMTPPIIAKKKNAVPTVIAASIGSIVGGIIAYIIGAYLFESVGMWLINNISSLEQFARAQEMFARHGILIILITAFTPIPYKLMSICAGFVGYNPFIYLAVSAIFRTGRFAIAGFLLWKFQKQASALAKKYFVPLTLIAIASAVAGVLMII